MADGSVIIDTELDQSGLRTGLAKLSSTALSGITKALTGAGTALVSLGAYAIKVGSDFEAGMSQVAATMGTTVDQIEDIATEAKRLGSETSFSAVEAAEGFNILAQSGLTASEQIAAMSHVLNLAAAGSLSLESAASYTIGTIKGFGDSCDNAQTYVDLIAKGATLANTSVDALGEALSSAAATANSYGQDVDSVTLSLLRLAEQNVTGSEAATALNRAMTDLYTPTSAAAAVLEELGIACYDANGNARDFNTIVDELDSTLSGYSAEQANAYKATIFTTYGLQAFNKMTVASEDKVNSFKEGIATASDAMDGAGSAAQQAATMLDNLQGSITILTSATEGFGDALYEALNSGDTQLRTFVDAATDLVGQLTDAVNEGGLSALPEAVGDVLAQAVTVVTSFIPQMISGASELLDGFVQGLVSAAPEIASAATGCISVLVDAVLSISDGLITLGAELIIAIAQGITDNAGEIISAFASGVIGLLSTVVNYGPQIVKVGAELVSSIAQGVVNAIPTLVEALPGLIDALISGYEDAFPAIFDCVTSLILSLVDALPGLMATLIDVLPSLIESIVNGLAEMYPMILECALKLALAIAQALPDIISSIVQALPNLIVSIVNAIVGCLPTLLECVLDIVLAIAQYLPQITMNIVGVLPTLISSIIAGLITALPTLLEGVASLVLGIVEALPDIIIKIVEILPTLIESISLGLIDNIGILIDCAIDMVMAIVEALPQIFVIVVETLVELVISLAKSVFDLWVKFKEASSEWITRLWEGIKDKFGGLSDNVRSVFKRIPEVIKEAIGNVSSIGKNLVQGIWNGISDAKEWILSKIRSFSKSILNEIKSFFGIASPSKVFRDVIGKNLMLGLGEGISGASKTAIDAALDAAEDISDVNFSLSAPTIEDGIDYEQMLAGARASVDISSNNTSTAISAPASIVHEKADDKTAERPEKFPDQTIDLSIGSKKIAKLVAHDVGGFMEWEVLE